MGYPIILYDSVCGLCNRFVQFILKRDRASLFRFASLQSDFAVRALSHRRLSSEPPTVCVILPIDPAKPEVQTLLTKSEAAIFVLSKLSGVWSAFAWLLRLIPRPVRDWGYDSVARHRYRFFGRYQTCPVPSPETSGRFLD